LEGTLDACPKNTAPIAFREAHRACASEGAHSEMDTLEGWRGSSALRMKGGELTRAALVRLIASPYIDRRLRRRSLPRNRRARSPPTPMAAGCCTAEPGAFPWCALGW
jgi:hypothetical protein